MSSIFSIFQQIVSPATVLISYSAFCRSKSPPIATLSLSFSRSRFLFFDLRITADCRRAKNMSLQNEVTRILYPSSRKTRSRVTFDNSLLPPLNAEIIGLEIFLVPSLSRDDGLRTSYVLKVPLERGGN